MPDLPLFLNVDSVYAGKHLAQPWGDSLAEGVILGGVPAGLDPLKVAPVSPAAMAVEVAAGAAWITNDAADDLSAYLDGGAWRVVQRSAAQVPIEAADATNPRIDRLILEVLDQQFGAASNLGRFRVVKGTPAGSPVAPAAPRSTLTLATVLAAAATSIAAGAITDARVAAKVGGRAAAAEVSFASVRANRGASLTVPNVTDLVIPMTAADDWDTHGMHDPAVNQTRITAVVPGKYLVTGNFGAQDPGAANDWNLWIRKLATTDYDRQRSRETSGTNYVSVSGVVPLAAGEWVEFYTRQNSGAASALNWFNATATWVAA